jgi:hypothetical protein
MKKSELNKLIENIIRKVLKETGEMGMSDIKPGGEDYEWAMQIKKAVQELSRLTKGKVKFIEMKPFDKYQGPYARVIIDGKHDSIWSVGDGGSGYYIENLEYAGKIPLLANAILGNMKDVEEAMKNREELK